MKSATVQNFDLSSTLESGQIFRYIRLPDGYLIHQRDRIFRVCQRGNTLCFAGAEKRFISHYFRLDEDNGKIIKTLTKDREVRRAVELYRGLRILRQDPWECLVSFLCSSTKSIAHIRVIVERLCRVFGEPVSISDYQGYAFPREGTINSPEKLKAIGLGFRARYVYEVNHIVQQGYLDDIVGKPYTEARALFMQLPGVGEKIADCVLLFSLGFLEAFPTDTWIKRGMEKTYFQGQRIPSKGIGEYARKRFGPYAGYAQQYLYHYWRERGRQSLRVDAKSRSRIQKI